MFTSRVTVLAVTAIVIGAGPVGRIVESICVVELCQERVPKRDR